ncbi:MAG: NADH-quinone oxidoreductase subunit J, partial [Anaerolineae bacterium]|nr:NADH-quinone oxidoreductase subunit J [Anaerolineae bacterium]
AVHSALFLIVNFACVAFFYLMLNAPFLAMVQIAVYAGAIMVLFLFVIMLLGAEKLTHSTREFAWLAPLALGLAAAFLLIVGVAIVQGQIDLRGPTTREPLLRVVHAVEDAGAVDVYANGDLVAQNVEFGAASGFEPVVPGEYTISLKQPGTETIIANSSATILESNEGDSATAFTAIAYGQASAPVIAVLPDNIETVEARSGRLTVFNGYVGANTVNLVDLGSPTNPDDDRVIAGDLQPAQTFVLPAVSDETSLETWAFVDGDNAANVLFRLDDPLLFNIKRDTSQLLVLSGQQVVNGASTIIRPIALPLVTKAIASFGGPQSIGQLLFTIYMLPFQLIAVLLLAAMIGAIVLTHKENATPRRRDVRRVVSKPLATAISAQTGTDVLASTQAEETPQLPENQPAGD